MGPVVGVPPLLRELGPLWDRHKGPIVGLMLLLLGIVALLWWFTGR